MNTDLPLFVYGALKEGEVAHRFISPMLAEPPVAACVQGYQLLVVDGVALAVEGDSGYIEGELMKFSNPEVAYERIANFEDVPNFYRFEETSILGESANLLVSNALSLQTRHEKLTRWTGAQDGLLAYGVPWSFARLQNLQTRLRDTSENYEFWMAYHDLQSTFQLLWSVVERILLFHDGAKNRGMPLGEKISWLREMQKHPGILEAVQAVGIEISMGVRSNRRPDAPSPHRTGTVGFPAWYEMRNNVVHRGKGTRVEKGLLWTATVDLHNTVAYFLEHNSDPIRELWEDLTRRQALSYSNWLYRIQR